VYVSSQSSGAWIYSLVRRDDGGYDQRRTAAPVWANPASRTWKALDVDGDGRADLVHAQCYQPFIAPLCIYQLDTFLSRGDGTFARRPRASVAWGVGTPNTPSWRPMDVNGDGRTDLVAMWFLESTSSFPPTGGVYVQTLLSNGDGTWAQQPVRGPFAPPLSPFDTFPGLQLQDTQSWRAADVDGDGRADLVRVGSGRGVTQVSTLLAADPLEPERPRRRLGRRRRRGRRRQLARRGRERRRQVRPPARRPRGGRRPRAHPPLAGQR
jgi:hypothetical protein